MLTPAQFEGLRRQIREIGSEHLLTDVHVHPFEVLVRGLTYRPHPEVPGVYSAGPGRYRTPEPLAAAAETPRPKGIDSLPEPWRSRALTLSLRRLYLHTGPRVFGDQMELSGIGRSVLLPVAAAGGGDEEQVRLLAEIFGRDRRFVLGCCVPAGTADERIEATVRAAVVGRRARIIKIHPDLSAIDVGSRPGRERIERILDAARGNRCPVIVHGGRSSAPADGGCDCATMAKLTQVDWSIARQPVVIAHAGAFGCALAEVREQVFPALKPLLAKHPNLMLDLSGLDPEPMRFLLGKLDPDRLLFGSDSLYFSQWKSLAVFFRTLRDSPHHPIEAFIKIAAHNPQQIFKGGEHLDAESTQDQVQPVC